MNIADFFNLDSGDDNETSSLQEVLLDELKDLYSAENQLVKALPKMEEAASSKKLKQAIRAHLAETKKHVERLEEIGRIIGKKLTGKTCKAMQGLVKEGEEAMDHDSENTALIDAMIIGAAQRVEHYEMAGYGTARAFAEQLGESRVVKLLQQTLNEEGAADKKLTEISLGDVLPQAFKGVLARSEQSDEEDSEADGIDQRNRSMRMDSNSSRGARGSRAKKTNGAAKKSRSNSRSNGAGRSTGSRSTAGRPGARGGRKSGRGGRAMNA
ncbi:MAG: ferritin-like domain-containing protein [Bdellovibrionota bacterium]